MQWMWIVIGFCIFCLVAACRLTWRQHVEDKELDAFLKDGLRLTTNRIGTPDPEWANPPTNADTIDYGASQCSQTWAGKMEPEKPECDTLDM